MEKDRAGGDENRRFVVDLSCGQMRHAPLNVAGRDGVMYHLMGKFPLLGSLNVRELFKLKRNETRNDLVSCSRFGKVSE